MTDLISADINPHEGPIARARRRARELGEEVLALAKSEAEQFIQGLGREPAGAERILIEHITILDVRTRMLRTAQNRRPAPIDSFWSVGINRRPLNCPK